MSHIKPRRNSGSKSSMSALARFFIECPVCEVDQVSEVVYLHLWNSAIVSHDVAQVRKAVSLHMRTSAVDDHGMT